MPLDFDAILAANVERVLGTTSITVSRTSGGTYNPATGAESGGSTIGPVTLTADEQATGRRTRGGSFGGADVEMDEVVYNIRAASVAATALETINEGDLITAGGIARAVCGVSMQADRSILRVVCRTEKRGR